MELYILFVILHPELRGNIENKNHGYFKTS